MRNPTCTLPNRNGQPLGSGPFRSHRFRTWRLGAARRRNACPLPPGPPMAERSGRRDGNANVTNASNANFWRRRCGTAVRTAQQPIGSRRNGIVAFLKPEKRWRTASGSGNGQKHDPTAQPHTEHGARIASVMPWMIFLSAGQIVASTPPSCARAASPSPATK